MNEVQQRWWVRLKDFLAIRAMLAIFVGMGFLDYFLIKYAISAVFK